jgi:predicted transcriptional regulator
MNLIGISIDPQKITFTCTGCKRKHVCANGEDTYERIKAEKKVIAWSHPHSGEELLCNTCAQKKTKSSKYTAQKKAINPTKVNEAEAIVLYNEGASLLEIGNKYGVTRERVRQILKGKVNKDRVLVKKPRCCNFCKDLLTEENKLVLPGIRLVLCCTKEACKIQTKHYSKCACGKVRTSTSEKCMACSGQGKRTFDYEMMMYLYKQGATGNQVGIAMGVVKITIYMALRRQKKLGFLEMRSKGSEATLTQDQVNRLYLKEKERRVCLLPT